MQQAHVHEPAALFGALVVRRDAPRDTVPRAGQRVRDSANGPRQIAADPVAGGGPRLGADLHRGHQSGTRSAAAETCAEGGRVGTEGRRQFSGRVRRTVREAGWLEEHQLGLQPRRSPEETSRRAPLDALEDVDEINGFKAESDYAEEVELATMHRTLETLRAAMNWGDGADAAALSEVAVPPVRRSGRGTRSRCRAGQGWRTP